jgi:peroxiredoxin (alkyl hydroperoxide reductase subunit C)
MGVLVGKPAPDFDVAAVLGSGEIVDSYKRSAAMLGKYGLVFFYPLDFTFVCPSELIALDHRMDNSAPGCGGGGPSIDSSSPTMPGAIRR